MKNLEPVLHNPEHHEFVFNLLSTCPAGRLLDIPSGPGYFAKRASGIGFNTVAAEIDESLHVFKDVVYEKVNMNASFPFKDRDFDYIVSIEGIEHIENQLSFLRECCRVLKKGGKIFITTPNSSSLENRLNFFITGFNDTPPAPIRSDLDNFYFQHINLIPFYRLEVFLRMAGFKILDVTTNRYQKGSMFLYLFILPFIKLRLKLVFRKLFKGRPEETMYRKIFASNWSWQVLCGSTLIIVAEKGD